EQLNGLVELLGGQGGVTLLHQALELGGAFLLFGSLARLRLGNGPLPGTGLFHLANAVEDDVGVEDFLGLAIFGQRLVEAFLGQGLLGGLESLVVEFLVLFRLGLGAVAGRFLLGQPAFQIRLGLGALLLGGGQRLFLAGLGEQPIDFLGLPY